MQNWFMLTLVGQDQLGIVARVSTALYEGGCNLGEASMSRLGGNFTMMLMVNTVLDLAALTALLEPVAETLQLHVHLDRIEGRLHTHPQPDLRISVYGADRAGIVARVTRDLAAAGFTVLDLTSDVGGTPDKPFYLMQIEGAATQGLPAVDAALQHLQQNYGHEIEVSYVPIETLVM